MNPPNFHEAALSRLDAQIEAGQVLLGQASKACENEESFNNRLLWEAFDWCESAAFAVWFASDGGFLDELEQLGYSPLNLAEEHREAITRPSELFADVSLHIKLLNEAKRSFRRVPIGDPRLQFQLLGRFVEHGGALSLVSIRGFLADSFGVTGSVTEGLLRHLMKIRVLEEADNEYRLTAEGWHHLRMLGRLFFMTPPKEIEESLARFRQDHPSSRKAAFIVMRFGGVSIHEKIVRAIRETLQQQGIEGLRADDKQYHDDLFYNIVTYMYGCYFGVAVFERIETDEFNPNISFEVGYMMAMGKPICLLKDRTLKTLHTDLIGKLYRAFDPHNPAKTIRQELSQWLADRILH